MAEFTHSEEQFVSKGEPIVFENKTECSFDVDVGVIFRKSGIYKVSIVGNRISISEITTRVDADAKTDVRENVHGEWIPRQDLIQGEIYDGHICSNCGTWKRVWEKYNYCPICGADMRGEE